MCNSLVWLMFISCLCYNFDATVADDFSGPAPSTTYTVGSMISIRATVTEWTGAPQQIFLDECIMTESPDPYMVNETRTVITDEG